MLSLGNKLSLTTQPIYKFVNEHSVDFDGVDDRIVTDGADTVAQNSTYSFWCKSSTTGANKGVFGHGGTYQGAFHFNYVSDRPLLYIGGSNYVFWVDTPAQDDGEWHHWVVYVDYDDISNAKLYVDSVLQTTHLVVQGSVEPFTQSLTIGSDRQVGGHSFEGKIDEFAVYDRELTQAEITRMFNTYYSPNRVANGNFAQIGNEEVTNGDFSQIGSEVVVNGDFATDSDWTKGTGWSIANGLASCDGTNTGVSNLQTTVGLSGIQNKQVKFSFNISNYQAGTITVTIEGTGGNEFSNLNSNGTYTVYVSSSDSLPKILFKAGAGFIGSIDNVSVKEVGQDWSFQGDWTMGDNVVTNTRSGTGFDRLQSDATIVVGKQYKFVCNIISKTGGTLLMHNDWADSNYFSTSGTGEQVWYFTATTTQIALEFAGDGETIVVDDLSVKEVGQHWTFGTGWSTDGTKAICAGDSSHTSLTTNYGFIAGRSYKVSFDITVTSGTFSIQLVGSGSDTGSVISTTTTNYTETIIPTANRTTFNIRSNDGDGVGNVDNIVVQELKHDATNLMLNAGAYQSANPLITSTKSMEFDGSDDYLTVSSFTISGEKTYSLWFKTTSADANTRLINLPADTGAINFTINAGKLNTYDGTNNPTTTTTWNDGNWHNGVLVMKTNDVKIYVDGVSQSLTWDAGSSPNFTIQTATNQTLDFAKGGSSYFDGQITEAGVYNRALTALEVASLYNQGMPTNLLVNRNNYQSGNPTVFNTKQVDFDGTDDRLEANSTLGSFTGSVSFWAKRADISGFQYLIDFRKTSGTGYVYLENNTHSIFVSSGTVYVDGVAGTTISEDNWHHIVVTGITLDITECIIFGARYTYAQFFIGEMSQVGLWNSTLTADEVSSLYNHGLPIDLTTDQAAYESSSNLVGYWRMGSGTLDSYPLIADQTNPTLGSELITNGDFLLNPINANSWFESFYPLGNVLAGSTWSWDSNTYIVTGGIQQGGSNNESQLQTAVTATVGRTYKFEAYVKSTNNKARLHVFTGNPDGSYPGSSFHSGSGNWELLSICFVATGNAGSTTSVNLRLQLSANQVGTETYNAEFKNATFKEVGGNPAYMTNMTSSDIEVGSPYANLVKNGTFDTDSDWSFIGDTEISGGYAVFPNAAGSYLIQVDVVPQVVKNYTLQYEIIETNGSSLYLAGGSNAFGTITLDGSLGVHTINITSNGTQDNLQFWNGGVFVGKIDNVTLAETNTGLQGYWKMGDGTNDEYPVIYDQTNPTNSAELVTNGDFSAGSTGWENAFGGEWVISGGKATLAVGADGSYLRTVSDILTSGKSYKAVITTSGGLDSNNKVTIYATSNTGQKAESDGAHTFYFTADGTSFRFLGAANDRPISIDSVSVKEVQGNPAVMTNMVEGNITNQFPLTKIRNYYRMGDGIMDGYPIIQDQTSPNLAHIPTTNLIPFSEDFNSSVGSFSYSKVNSATVTNNSITAPDGTNTGALVTKGTGQLVIRANNVVETNKTYAFSCYVKSSGSGVTSVSIDISDGITPTFTLTNDWQRISVSSEVTRTPQSTYNFVDISAIDGSQGDTFYTWGWQVEEQSQATAYIKSDGIAAVRKSSTTNLIPYSEDFTVNSSWIKNSNYTLTPNSIISPDGTQNATKVLVDTSNGAFRTSNTTVTPSTNYVFSFYVKRGTASEMKYRVFDYTDPYVDIVFKTSYYSQTNTETWVRIEVPFTTPSGTTLVSAYIDSDGQGNGYFYVWGAQFEEQTQAETYAPTTGLPVTIDLFTENNYGTMTNMSASDIVEDTP